jgi:Protein of unknown function (DUF429)
LTRLDLREFAAELPDVAPATSNPIERLAARLISALPELRRAVVMVDSPRWPRDLNRSRPNQKPRERAARLLDSALRTLANNLRELGANPALSPLSMFPTPPMRYFGSHLNSTTCKRHLQCLGRALFGHALDAEFGPAAGGIFTRFMVAGFATYRALELLSVDAYEAYPDLQFRLWSSNSALPPKASGQRPTALTARLRVVKQLARTMDIAEYGMIHRLDEADAAVLVLSAAAARHRGAIIVLEHPREGQFAVALSAADAARLHTLYPQL